MIDLTVGELKYFQEILTTKQYGKFIDEVDVDKASDILKTLGMENLKIELRIKSLIRGNTALFNRLS